MPIHIDELTNGERFPVKPDTNDYEALSFLVANHTYGFTPAEIADNTGLTKSSASKTMARLFDKDLVERSDSVYYVDPERADTLRQRLESLDAGVQLVEPTPTDDVYAEEGWEEELPSLNLGDESGSAETHDPIAVDAEDEDLILDLEGDTSGMSE